MKNRQTIFRLAAFLLISLCVSSCNNQEEKEVYLENSKPLVHYDINIGFNDKSGNDKLDGLNFDTKTGYVAENEYSYQTSLSVDPYLKIQVVSFDGEKYLNLIGFADPNFNIFIPTVVTQVLKCRYIFGDDKQHTITSFWNKSRPLSFRCAKVLLDGNEIEVKYDESQGRPYVRAVL